MSRKLDRLRALLQAEIAARPAVYRIVLVGLAPEPDLCAGHVVRERGSVADAAVAYADARCGRPHPHPMPAPRRRGYGRVRPRSST